MEKTKTLKDCIELALAGRPLTQKSSFRNAQADFTPSPVGRGHRKVGFTLAEVFSIHPKDVRKHAFTLAEVLITLGIIGVVAAMTLPTLIQKQKEKQTVVKLKNIYSILSQAYTRAVQEYGPPTEWEGLGNVVADDFRKSANSLLDHFAPFLKYTEICRAENVGTANAKCKYNEGTLIKAINGQIDDYFSADNGNATYARLRLNNGAFVSFSYFANANRPACGVSENDNCGYISVDINGKKLPNQQGVDIFSFFIMNNRILPMGGIGSSNPYSFKYRCLDKTKTIYGSSYGLIGEACTAWVLQNENMDYLHCDDLSWEGKHSCNGK
jgi:prepilin-type N-terminal cleavage/methylation domain-containing protein